MASPKSLPKNLKPYFWDYPFSRLSLRTDRDLIIRRVLSNGSWNAIRWLKKKIGNENLRKWLIAHQGRGLSPRQLRFWELILDLPKRQKRAYAQNVMEGEMGRNQRNNPKLDQSLELVTGRSMSSQWREKQA